MIFKKLTLKSTEEEDGWKWILWIHINRLDKMRIISSETFICKDPERAKRRAFRDSGCNKNHQFKRKIWVWDGPYRQYEKYSGGNQ